MLEKYLCVGGIEIAHPTRTLTYLANMGHGLLASAPNPNCGDCFPIDISSVGCEVPYTVQAGFDQSVNGEIAAMVFALFRGAEPIERVGIHREVHSVLGSPFTRPAVPTTGWVVSDYIEPLSVPLLLSVDSVSGCVATDTRFERLVIYDIERWPVPDTSPGLAPGEHPGKFSVLWYIDPCSAEATGDALATCSVSFDEGLTWSNLDVEVTPGRASGYIGAPVACAPSLSPQWTFTTDSDSVGFCHEFAYVSGGSGHFDVEVWMAPTVYTPGPPSVPVPIGEPTIWQLIGLGTVAEGVITAPFPESLCEQWPDAVPPPVEGGGDPLPPPEPVGWYYKLWRWTDRVSRAVYELVVAINGLNLHEETTDWDGAASYSIDGGATWHVPSGTVLTQPVPMVDPVPVRTVVRDGGGAFTDPVTDNAPWYDPNEPDSADVLGVWIEEMTSPVPYKREIREQRWGGSLPPSTLTSRELHIVGYVYTRSCKATEYARRWLFEALAQEGCSSCELPDALVYRGCDPGTDSAQYARTLRRVGLIELDDELEPEFPCCLGFKFEATLRAEVPYLYRDPAVVYDGPIVNLDDDAMCNICSACPPVPSAPFACGCMDRDQVIDRTVVRRTDKVAACFCSPATVRRYYVPIDSLGFEWSDATARFTLHAGSPLDGHEEEALRNLRIMGFQNPLGLVSPIVDGENFFDCQVPCVDMEVSCLPPSSTLVIDGAIRRSTLTAGPANLNGYGYLSSGGGSKFQWPDVGCNGLMLCIETDAVFTGSDTRLTVELIGRERR